MVNRPCRLISQWPCHESSHDYRSISVNDRLPDPIETLSIASDRRAGKWGLIRPDDGAMRMMDLEEKKAVVTDSRGSAELTRRDDGDFVRIVDTEGKLLYEGILGDRPEQSTVPEGWRKQVCAMRRGLDHALSASPAPAMRLPRPRIVMPTVEETTEDKEE